MSKFIYTLLFCFIATVHAHAQPGTGLVVNEVLFNPSKDGYDFVEIFNSGKDSFNLETAAIANRNVTRDLSGIRGLSKNRLLLAPGAFAVATANEKWLRLNYSVSSECLVLQVTQMPSFPDDKGTVVLCNKSDSLVLDELNYDAKWHFLLLSDQAGVALERINYKTATDDKNNWTSASSSSGYGTPGSRNSQFRVDMQANGELNISPKVFSPDNDGIDDYATLLLQMNEPGYTVNTFIYDANGRRVRYLLKNELLGLRNQFRWDGYDDNQQRLSKGVYIFYTSIFNLSGRTKKFRNVIVLNYSGL